MTGREDATAVKEGEIYERRRGVRRRVSPWDSHRQFNPSASPSLNEVSARLANDGCVLAHDSKRRIRDGQEMIPIATIEISIGQSTSYRFPIPIPAVHTKAGVRL